MADTGTTLGKAYVQIMPSAEGIKGRLENVLGGEMPAAGKSAGSSLGQSLVSTLKTVIAAAGIGAAFKASISEGMDLQQNLGGTEAVFGDFADSIKATAADAYKSMGMSASEYMATANKMGSLFQGSGLEQQQALDLTTQAMQRAADVASVMGIDTSMAMESIAGAAKGNFTMMDNLGVAMNATTLEAYALEKGVNFEWKTASNAEKAQLAMQMFMERTSQYEGNFARESEQTLSGSLGAMQSAFKNVLGNLAVGADVVPAMQSLVDTVCSFLLDNLLPAVGNILGGLPNIVGTLTQGIRTRLPELLSMAGEAVGSLVSGIMENLPLLAQGAVNIMAGLGTHLRENMPTLLTSGLEMLVGLTGSLRENAGMMIDGALALIQSLAQGLADSLPALIENVPLIVSNIANIINDNAPKMLESAFNILVTLGRGLIEAIPTLIANIPQILQAIADVITAFNWIDLGGNIIKSLGSGLKAMTGGLRDFMSQTFQGAIEFIKGLPAQALQWGKDFIGGLIKGITGSIGGVLDAVKNIGSAIASYLHFSRPDLGPLRDYETWMPDMVAGLADGIRAGRGEISRAVGDLAEDMRAAVSNMDTNPVSLGASAALTRQPFAVAYQPAAGNTVNRREVTIQSGAIVINAAPGQDAREIADAVMERINRLVVQKEAAFA